MNERIRELADKATTKFFNEDGSGFRTFSREKFAELIVLECAGVCLERASQYQVNHLITDEAIFCSIRIKQHFGVEE